MNTRFIGPHSAYDASQCPNPKGTAVTVREANHTPENKRHGEVEATAEFTVRNGPEWVSVELTEWVSTKAGMRRKRISICMPRTQAEQFAQHVFTGPRELKEEA